MTNNIFIPKTITVGCQKRSDTFTGTLAYVIYTDHKGVLRKKESWENWRDKTIEPQTFENIPTEGFVLNKKVGGDSWGWNPRQTYSRIYDPRGFEFEITIPNLLYILENANSIKGKGLAGNFVYGWQGKDLILVPEQAPEYQEMLNFTAIQDIKFSKKDLISGWKYLNKKNEVVTYLGYYEEYQNWYGLHYCGTAQKSFGKKHWFYKQCENGDKFVTFSSYNNLVKKLEEDVNYPFIMDKLEQSATFSPVEKVEFEPITKEKIINLLQNSINYLKLYIECDTKVWSAGINKRNIVENGNSINIDSHSLGYYYDKKILESPFYHTNRNASYGNYKLFQESTIQNFYILKTTLKNGKSSEYTS